MSCNNEVAVSVRGLSKAYQIFESPGKRLCYHLFKVQTGRDFWALDNINFDIRKGEAFGIILSLIHISIAVDALPSHTPSGPT